MTTSTLSEPHLVSCAQTEPAAFAILYDQSYDKVLHYLLKRCQQMSLESTIKQTLKPPVEQ